MASFLSSTQTEEGLSALLCVCSSDSSTSVVDNQELKDMDEKLPLEETAYMTVKHNKNDGQYNNRLHTISQSLEYILPYELRVLVTSYAYFVEGVVCTTLENVNAKQVYILKTLHNGNLLVGYKRSVLIWEETTGKLLFEYKNALGRLYDYFFTRMEKLIIKYIDNSTPRVQGHPKQDIKIFDVETNTCLLTYTLDRCVIFDVYEDEQRLTILCGQGRPFCVGIFSFVYVQQDTENVSDGMEGKTMQDQGKTNQNGSGDTKYSKKALVYHTMCSKSFGAHQANATAVLVLLPNENNQKPMEEVVILNNMFGWITTYSIDCLSNEIFSHTAHKVPFGDSILGVGEPYINATLCNVTGHKTVFVGFVRKFKEDGSNSKRTAGYLVVFENGKVTQELIVDSTNECEVVDMINPHRFASHSSFVSTQKVQACSSLLMIQETSTVEQKEHINHIETYNPGDKVEYYAANIQPLDFEAKREDQASNDTSVQQTNFADENILQVFSLSSSRVICVADTIYILNLETGEKEFVLLRVCNLHTHIICTLLPNNDFACVVYTKIGNEYEKSIEIYDTQTGVKYQSLIMKVRIKCCDYHDKQPVCFQIDVWDREYRSLSVFNKTQLACGLQNGSVVVFH